MENSVVERKQSKPPATRIPSVTRIALLTCWFRYAFGYRLRLLYQQSDYEVVFNKEKTPRLLPESLCECDKFMKLSQCGFLSEWLKLPLPSEYAG